MVEIIQKSMTIGEVVQKYPETTSVMMRHGLHCVGCSVAYHETLEEGVKAHGGDDSKVDLLVKDMNAEVEAEKSDAFITVTRAAARKIKEFAEQEKKKPFLRMGIAEGGCAGFSYELELVDAVEDDEEKIEDKGVTLLVKKDQVKLLKGTRVDYLDTMQESGFRIINPNAHTSCGCDGS